MNKLKRIIKRGLKYVLHGVPINYTIVNLQQKSPTNHLKNRCVLITGGGRGLGFAVAKKCISEGSCVIITGRNEETLKNAAEELGEMCYYIPLNVQNVSEIKKIFVKASNLIGGKKIDSLVSNAGVSLHEGDFRNVTEEGWDNQIDTNLKGNYFMVTEFIKYLETFEDKRGNILVVTSERSKRPDFIPYGLTKVASNSFIQAIAAKVIEEGIRLNGIAPGVTCSDMTGFSKDGNMYADWLPSKRIFMPEEVAEVANFLLSDFSSCISGEIIACDQGRYISHW